MRWQMPDEAAQPKPRRYSATAENCNEGWAMPESSSQTSVLFQYSDGDVGNWLNQSAKSSVAM